MNIVFFTRESEICQQMANLLEKQGYRTSVISDEIQFFYLLTDTSFTCDVWVCDYRAIPHQSFNIYNYLKSNDAIKPVVFYNDPIAQQGKRAEYWLRSNENLYVQKDFDKFVPFFKILEAIVESSEINPYISLLQPPLPMVCKENENFRKIDLEKFRRRNKLSPEMFKLFEFFYQNTGREVSVNNILKILCLGKKEKPNPSSIYTYISRLRKALKNDKLVKVDIIRTNLASYEMIIY